MRPIVLAGLITLACFLVLCPNTAHAAMAAGGNMPWDTGLQTLQKEFTGPLPFFIGILAFVVALGGLAFGHNHLSGIIQSLLWLTMIVACLVNIPNLMSLLAGSGAVV